LQLVKRLSNYSFELENLWSRFSS